VIANLCSKKHINHHSIMTTKTTDYPTFSPYLTVHDAAAAIKFYQAAFGATEVFRLTNPSDGKIGHAELQIDGGLIMLGDENPQWGNKSPKTLGGTPINFCLHVKNADVAFDRAVAAGASVKMPVADQFYGYRSGIIIDPFGHEWMLQHEIEKVSHEEMQKRWDAMGGECSNS
jgi:PhnB protein